VCKREKQPKSSGTTIHRNQVESPEKTNNQNTLRVKKWGKNTLGKGERGLVCRRRKKQTERESTGGGERLSEIGEKGVHACGGGEANLYLQGGGGASNTLEEGEHAVTTKQKKEKRNDPIHDARNRSCQEKNGSTTDGLQKGSF